MTCAPGINEIALSGAQIRDLVKTAGSLTGDIRVVAIRAVAGTGTGSGQNGVVAPAGTNTISLQTECC